MTGKKKKKRRTPKWLGPIKGRKADVIALDEAKHVDPPQPQLPKRQPRLPPEAIHYAMMQLERMQWQRLLKLFYELKPPQDMSAVPMIMKCRRCESKIQLFFNGTQVICPVCKDFLMGFDIVFERNREWYNGMMEKWKEALPKVNVKNCSVQLQGGGIEVPA